jgi:L-ribulokinase
LTDADNLISDFPGWSGFKVYAIGVDFGSNSVRALVVRCSDGLEVGVAVVDYPSGDQGILYTAKDPFVARQNPADYLYGLELSVRNAIEAARVHPGFSADNVVGIGVDTTGSSPLPLDRKNRPLALDPRFKDNLDAQCWLWKDHSSFAEAQAITERASHARPHFIAKCGSTYSSEWWWAKIWHCLNIAPEVFDAAYSWAEIADWIPSVLAGVEDPAAIRRGICAAGHKAFYSDEWGGLPDEEFLASLDPRLAGLRDRLYTQAFDASASAGKLSPEWARKLGLPEGIAIAVGAFDVHYGAIGCGIGEGMLVKVIGTSTCDCVVVDIVRETADIPGICGIVPGSILPGYLGIEAGQSAVGDIFKWWVEGVCMGDAALHRRLTEEASNLRPAQSGLIALDWNNGNRTILVDQLLTGLLIGQTLHTTRSEIYRALIEATAYGARAIIERIRDYGVRIDRVVCTGGIAEKNPLLMQIYADVTGCTMEVAASAQTCALGSAIVASVLGGAHDSLARAQLVMTSLRPEAYEPKAENVEVYNRLYGLYRILHDGFGGVSAPVDMSAVMKDLLLLKAGA